MIYIYGIDYIKYLNDTSSHSLTYDQWKNKKMQQNTSKCVYCGSMKESYHSCPRCHH